MDTTIIVHGNWEEQKANLIKRFAILTNSEIIIEQAKKKDMFDKLQIEIIKKNDQIVDWKTKVILLLKHTFITSAMLLTLTSIVNAQTGKLYLKDESKKHTTINILTSQYGEGTANGKNDVSAEAKKLTGSPAIQSVAVNVVASDNTFGMDKYLKVKETGKRYKEFQVFDVNGMDMDLVLRGMVTSNLERVTRYTEKGAPEQKVSVAIVNGFIPKLDDKGNVMKNAEKVSVSAISFKDKVFVIIGEHDYRYLDGKRLVGGQKLVDELIKGKPVTETTFFYELKKVGVLNDAMTLLQFSKMNLAQKQSLLKGGSIVADF